MANHAQGTPVPALTFQNTTFNIVDHNGEAWLKAQEIALALGYADDASITRIFARHAKEFTDKMTSTVKLTVQVQDRETRIFSLRGAHLIAMFARTAKAAEFRHWALDVLDHKTMPAATPDHTSNPLNPRLTYVPPAVRESIKQRAWVLAQTSYEAYQQQMLSAAESGPANFDAATWVPIDSTNEILKGAESLVFFMQHYGQIIDARAREIATLAGKDYDAICGAKGRP